MGVKEKNRRENEKNAIARRFHFEETPKQPANEKHIESAVTTLPDVEQELNRGDEQRGRGEGNQPASGKSPKKEVYE